MNEHQSLNDRSLHIAALSVPELFFTIYVLTLHSGKCGRVEMTATFCPENMYAGELSRFL